MKRNSRGSHSVHRVREGVLGGDHPKLSFEKWVGVSHAEDPGGPDHRMAR